MASFGSLVLSEASEKGARSESWAVQPATGEGWAVQVWAGAGRTRGGVVRHVKGRAELLEPAALEEGHVRVEVIQHRTASHDEALRGDRRQ